jgi:hypothetical protein
LFLAVVDMIPSFGIDAREVLSDHCCDTPVLNLRLIQIFPRFATWISLSSFATRSVRLQLEQRRDSVDATTCKVTGVPSNLASTTASASLFYKC